MASRLDSTTEKPYVHSECIWLPKGSTKAVSAAELETSKEELQLQPQSSIPTKATSPSIFAKRHPFLALVLLVCALREPCKDPQGLLGDTTTWQKYVRAPSEKTLLPKYIISTSGNVENAEALLHPDTAISSPREKTLTVLTRSEGSSVAPSLVIDFGQNVVGLLTIKFAGAENYGDGWYPGLRLAFSETLECLTDRSDFTRSDNAQGDLKIVPSGTDQIAVKPEPYTWLAQWGCEFDNKVCSDGLHGFRYIRISLDAITDDKPYTSKFGQVKISYIKLQWSGYHGTPDTYTGWFECSDKDLSQWWYDASYTNEMCIDTFRKHDTEPRDAFNETLVNKTVLYDGAKRDRDPYMGDVAIAGVTTYLTHDITEAARNVLEDLALHQRSDGWIPPASIFHYTLSLFDYPLWWVVSSRDYVFYTGDIDYIRNHYQTLQSVLNVYYPRHTDPKTSLLVRPPGYGDYAFIPRDGSAAYYNALYVLALKHASTLATLLSQPTDATNWLTRAHHISDSFLTTLWDPTVSAFLDRNCTGPGCTAHAQDGNSLAILAGIVPPNSHHAKSILSYLSTLAHPWGNAFYDAAGDELNPDYSQRVYAFTSNFEIAARFLSGNATSALEELRRLYGWMASHDPFSTFWEGIGRDGGLYEGGFTSMAHGWSTGIVALLTNYVLGVEPLTPGFEEWVVCPRPGDLEWAKGRVPTPFGGLDVKWAWKEDGRVFEVFVHAPAETKGRVVVPKWRGGAGKIDCVMLDDVVLWNVVGNALLEEVVELNEAGSPSLSVTGGRPHVLAVHWTH